VGQGGTVRQEIMIFSSGKEMEIVSWEQGFFVHCRIVSAVKRVEFVSDRLSYIVLRGCWRNIIVVNVHHQVRKKVMRQKIVFIRN